MNRPEEIDFGPIEKVRHVDYWIDRAVATRIRPGGILVVSGYWRSGTTWLQQSLASILLAKTVFEPLHPAVTRELYREILYGKDDAFREIFLPWGGAGPHSRQVEQFLGRALWSKLPPVATRILRARRREALRPRVVAKVVRAHLCLRALRDAFHTPIIHVVRDVRAVVASIAMTDWAWQFDRLSLKEQLLDVDDGRAAYFDAWREQIVRYDRGDNVAKIVVYWALLERFVEESFPLDERNGIRLVRYSDLVHDPEASVSELLESLGFGSVPPERLAALRQDSATTSGDRKGGLSTEERIAGWATRLKPGEVRRIEDIVDEFGMSHRLVNA